MSNELKKIEKFRYELALAETWEEINNFDNKASVIAEFARRNKISLEKQNDLGKFRIEIEQKKGAWLKDHFPHGAREGEGFSRHKVPDGNLMMPTTKKESTRSRLIAEADQNEIEDITQSIIKKNDVITPQKVEKELRKIEKEKEKELRKKEYGKKAKNFNDSDIKIINDDFRNIDIETNSVDLILTDPPYPKEYLELWQDLFVFAEKVLKPSCFLICYSGQMYLDQIFKMENNLLYYWMMNIIFSKKPLIHGRNIINEWKPILVFQKKPFKKISDTISDTISFDYSERDLHEKNWGQTIKPFELLLQYFSNLNDLIIDPFAGTGTTLIACKRMNRKCIGIEIEKEYIDLIKGRLNEI